MPTIYNIYKFIIIQLLDQKFPLVTRFEKCVLHLI